MIDILLVLFQAIVAIAVLGYYQGFYNRGFLLFGVAIDLVMAIGCAIASVAMWYLDWHALQLSTLGIAFAALGNHTHTLMVSIGHRKGGHHLRGALVIPPSKDPKR